jgi:magnesium-transporting ATPase (P-type)
VNKSLIALRKLPPCCGEFHNRPATDSVTVRIINLHLKMASTLSISGISQSRPFGKGLSGDEARRRLAEYGPNEPAAIQRATFVKQLLLLFANPLVIILLIASLVSAMIGDVVNASIIVVIVLLSNALNFTQTARSQRTAERLRKEVAPIATALRDGEWRVIPRRELVPGDLIQLVAGDLIPADARLVESRDLHVQQAALTGESLPVTAVRNRVGGRADAGIPADDHDRHARSGRAAYGETESRRQTPGRHSELRQH